MTEPQMQILPSQYNLLQSTLFLLCLFSLSCQAIRLDINLNDPSGAKRKVKLVCENMESNPLLGEGKEFPKTIKSLNVSISDVVVNSEKYLKCFIVETYIVAASKKLKNRIYRDITAVSISTTEDPTDAIPVERGLCQPGYRIHGHLCFPCQPGSYSSGQEATCKLCKKNYFIDFKAAPDCWPCPEGKVTAGEGSPSVDSCIAPRKFLGTPPSGITSIHVIVAGVLLTVILISWFVYLYWYYLYRKKRSKNQKSSKDFGIIEQGTSNRRGTAEDEALYSDFDSEEEDDDTSNGSVELHLYESVSPSQSDEHIYEEIGPYQEERTNNHSNGYEVPITQNTRNTTQSSQGYYSVPPSKTTLDNRNTFPRPIEKPPLQQHTYTDDAYEVPVNRDNIVMQVQIPPVKMNTLKHVKKPSNKTRNEQHKNVEKPSNESKLQYHQTSKSKHAFTNITDPKKLDSKDLKRHQRLSKKCHNQLQTIVSDGPSIGPKTHPSKTGTEKSPYVVVKITEDTSEVSKQGVENYISPLKSAYVGQEKSEPSKSARYAKKTLEKGRKLQSSHKKVYSKNPSVGSERLSLLNEKISKILEADPVKVIRVSNSEEALKKNFKGKEKTTELPLRKVKSEEKSNGFLGVGEGNAKNFQVENVKVVVHQELSKSDQTDIGSQQESENISSYSSENFTEGSRY